MNVKYKCEMLIDQNRYIGDDPIGHCCNNDAEFETKEGYLMCPSCVNLSVTEPERLSYPSVFGRKYQDKIFKKALKDLEEISQNNKKLGLE